MEQQRADDVVGGTNDPFGLTVLLGGMWSRETKTNTMLKKKRASNVVVEFAVVVTLDTLDDRAKL